MRILFVPNPHVRLDRHWAASYIPLELLSGMAVAEAAGAEPALFDLNRLVEHGRLAVGPEIWRQAALLLGDAEPDLVLFETWSGTVHNSIALLDAFRTLYPQVPTLLCGAGTSAVAVEALEAFPAADGVIRGEIEPSLAVLAARGRVPPSGLPEAPGLVRRIPGGIQDAALAWVENLDKLPLPAYHLGLIHPGDSIPLELGRGCGQACVFCALAGHWPARYRQRSIDRLADLVLRLGREYPGAALDFTQDPCFFGEPTRVRALCGHLLTVPPDIRPRWSCVARPDRLEPAELRLMAEAGCRGILFGIETGCPAIQTQLGKRVELERIEPAIRAAAGAGIEVRATFIVGHPGEGPAELAATVEAALRALDAGAGQAPLEVLRAYPGSRIHRDFRDRLEFEPLLCTAAPSDASGRRRILDSPGLLPASYRVPAGLPGPKTLAVWLALSALPEVVLALWRHGLGSLDLVERLALRPGAYSIEEALAPIAVQLEELAETLPGVDPATVHDLIVYHLARFRVSRQACSDRQPPDHRQDGRRHTPPDRIVPRSQAPWALLLVGTDPEALEAGSLAPAPLDEPLWLLLAKVDAAGDTCFYTRRNATLETFILDPAGGLLMQQIDRGKDLAELAAHLERALGLSPARSLALCREVVAELVRASVLDLADA